MIETGKTLASPHMSDEATPQLVLNKFNNLSCTVKSGN